MMKISEYIGIREQVIVTFFVFVTASLWIFQILATSAVNDVATSGQDSLKLLSVNEPGVNPPIIVRTSQGLTKRDVLTATA